MPTNDIVTYAPLGGINSEDSEDAVEETQVIDARNLLFERMEVMSRPGLGAAVSLTGISSKLDFARSFRGSGTPIGLAVSGNNLFKLDSALVVTTITGAGVTMGDLQYHQAEIVNGEVLLSNNTGGLVRWNPTGVTYVVISDAKYRFVTSHLTRVVGANQIGASPDVRKVGWSAAGDIGDWLGPSAGSVILADTPDDITGIGTIKNVLVIVRREGFHLGFATGVTLPVFRFDTFTRKGVGCPYSSTFAVENDVAYFVGADDIYTFDLRSIEPIGYPIRSELLRHLTGGAIYRGHIARLNMDRPRLVYHLMPDSKQLPHFTFDVKQGTWAKHFYEDFSLRGGFYRILGTKETISLFDDSSTPKVRDWDPEVACESESWLVGRVLQIGQPDRDARVSRVMIKSRDVGIITATLSLRTATSDAERAGVQVQMPLGTAVAGGRWRRAWADIQVSGQDFQLDLRWPANTKASLKHAIMHVTDVGGFRGTISS